MEKAKIALPNEDYIINEELKSWCEKVPDEEEQANATKIFLQNDALPITKLV